jgi:phage-related protein
MPADLIFGISDQGLFGAISSVLEYILSFIKTLVEQASIYAVDFLKQLWNDPTKTITFLTLLGVVLV